MSNDDPSIISKEGYLQVKLNCQPKWHRRYCIIDWDKATLFVASKSDRQYGDWIKLLPNIFIIDSELPTDFTIEIKADNETHFLLLETKKEHDCWLIALKRTAYSRFGGGIFGQSLEDTHKYSLDKTSLVPAIIRQCCEYLLEYGISFVGLFRIPGKQSLIRELRDKYDRGEIIELNSSFSPATISSLLKMYLHSLPEPIIPMKNFDEFMELGSCFKYNQTNDLDRLKQLIETTLSNVSNAVLAYLCLFLKKLTEYAHETKMDTENIAIVFGSNLIRTSEELDINMIKGHNYNLIPLIKAFIDHSDYLFTTNLIELSEQRNGSITKSSGFSSFSSLLSSNEHQVITRTRSSSLPLIPYAIYSSSDSANFSSNDHLNNKDVQYRSKSVTDKPLVDTSYQFKSRESSTTCTEKENSINEEKDEKQLSSTEMIKNEKIPNTQLITKEQKRKTVVPVQFGSKNNASPVFRKTTKKTFVDKFGKSLSHIRLSMTKAFYPNIPSTETNHHHSNTIDVSSFRPLSHQHDEHRSLDSNLLTDYLKTLQNEICVLKGIIDQKETQIIYLTKTSDEDHLKYEQENLELRQQIEQLQFENSQLKALDQPDN